MPKTKSKKRAYNKTSTIDLSEKKYLEIVEITNDEYKLLNELYNKMFEEINRDIMKRTDEYIKSIEINIKDKLICKHNHEIDTSSLLQEYEYIIKNNKMNAEIIDKFNDYYKYNILSEEQEN